MNLKKFIDFSSEKIYKTDNVNNQKIFEKINDFKPDVIITRGTSIIKEPLVNYPVNYFLNIHGGLVPNYRNVHSVFGLIISKISKIWDHQYCIFHRAWTVVILHYLQI